MESRHVVAPEGKAGESEMQSATQRTGKSIPRAARVASPVQRITLATSPCGTCPHDTVASHVFCYLVCRLLIEQGIEVVEKFRRHILIYCIHVDILAEVCLYTLHSHVEQSLQQALIPLRGFLAREVDGSGIVEGGEVGAFGILLLCELADIVVLACLVYLLCILCYIRQLPQRHLEALLEQVLHELLRVGEALLVELPFAEPVGLEPSRVEMDNVARIMLLAQTVADAVHFVGTEICHTAHPYAEAPQRWHRRIACEVAVAAEYLFHRVAAYDEGIDECLVAHELNGAR